VPDPASIGQHDDDGEVKDERAAHADAAQPLAPPPRPAAPPTAGDQDYFSGSHAQYSLEPNLFDASFSNPAADAPGKSLLPSVAALASPAILSASQNPAAPYGWAGSLRSGPLSPAMLSGPTGVAGGADYFDQLRSSFPTPNESSLRTGLTPGGGGSMFPAPSPDTQAFINSLAGGIPTPGTLDFHRTALTANAATRQPSFANGLSQAPEHRAQPAAVDAVPPPTSHHHFGQHDNDAANGLFMLAQAGNDTQAANQFSVPAQPTRMRGMQPDAPNGGKHARGPGSVGSGSGSAREISGEASDVADRSKPNTRGRNKRTSAKAGGGRRKPEETPTKAPASKKAKNNNGGSRGSNVYDVSADGGESDEEVSMKEDQYHENGKKMTDDEKRKNFLERNR
jgi:ATF/CREB family transcription factor